MQKHKRSKIDEARYYLQGGGVSREDSDDELGQEDHPWEWIYDNDSIVGAKMGSFECYVGDTVLLKAAGNEAWVAIIRELSDGQVEDEDGETVIDKKATFMWFSSEKEIVNKPNKRSDFLPNELYITTSTDDNSLTTINGKATVLSPEVFNARYPTAKVPRGSKDYAKVFVCRRGCNLRTTTYTDEFTWEHVYHGAQDLESLSELVDGQTVRTRRRKPTAKQQHHPDDFLVRDDDDEDEDDDEDDNEFRTPRKRRRTTAATPTSKRNNNASPLKKQLLTTPSHRRIINKKPLEFTPLGTRVLAPSHVASPHQLARSTLHVSAVPNALPCREDEFAIVYSHLEAAITANTGACIYISGTPGTGKTATVREVVAALNVAVSADELDDFVFVEINGMKVTDPHNSYSLLWEALKGQRVSASHALELLEKEFSTPSPRRVPCVVLMDELDQLVTRSQGVMYNFFNWPQLKHSRLIVLAVANTMDLPERTLSNKISSRLGLTRITFPGYTHQQLIKIIQSRLEGVGKVVVEPDAVQFASRKVAAVSGDARRALDVCRRAVEIAEAEVAAGGYDKEKNNSNNNNNNQDGSTTAATVPATSLVDMVSKGRRGIVTISTIKKAINEATATPLSAYLRSLPLASKLFLAALLARLRRTGIGESVLGDVVDEAKRISVLSELGALEQVLLAPDHHVGGVGGAAAAAAAAAADDKSLLLLVGGAPTPAAAMPSRKRGRAVRKKESDKAARIRGMGSAAAELAAAGIIGLENRRGERMGRVRLGVGEDEVRGALRDDDECRGLGFAG